jgi:GT2 family glycosyltransferase
MASISVIIPTRHRNAQLARCLDRLAPGRQTLDATEYEVIVTDDGSNSTAESLVREKYPWARWVAGPRRGPASNRNNGARHAAGHWLAFTDDDCLPAPDWLECFLAAAAPAGDVLEGKTTCQAGILTPLQEAPINLQGGNLWSCNFMIRSRLFQEIGGFDDSFPMPACEDIEFNARLRRLGHVPLFVPTAIVDHPPRPRHGGWRLGLMWESRVNLWYKEGNVGSVWSWLPIHLLKYRIGRILEYPIRWHTVRALASLALEFTCVLMYLGGWEARYCPPARLASRRRVLNGGTKC